MAKKSVLSKFKESVAITYLMLVLLIESEFTRKLKPLLYKRLRTRELLECKSGHARSMLAT